MQTHIQPATSRQRYLALLAAALTLALVLAAGWNSQIALAGESNRTGRIEARPAGTLIGSWTVAGTSFVTNSNTEFRQDKGAFAIGVCVEVEYVGAAQPFTATKIASKSDDDCGGGSSPTGTPSTGTPSTGTPGATPSVTPSGTPSPGSEREVYGRIEQMPSSGLIGTWVVGGVSYSTSGGTEFKQRNGPFVLGACVKIHYGTGNSPFPVRELETESTADCTGNSGTPVSTPGSTATSTPTGEREVYGTVDSFPAGLVGNWMINGVTYITTGSSEFKQEDGAFAVGACVKLHVQNNTIRELETEQRYRCGGSGGGGGSDDGSGEAELYGILQSFPTGLIGTWNIGGMTFVADASTEFKQRNGSFAVGSTVKVHFRTESGGDNRAREIETSFANDSGGRDDDGNGSFEGAEGHAYGTIDSFPSNRIGGWRVGGIDYAVTANTVLAENDGAFATGKQIKVEYHLDGNSGRVARKIETTSDNGGATTATRFKLFGFVSAMPANGFVGAWVVDNIAFTATSSAQFKENNGLLSLGAYVAVEYALQNGQMQVHEIESHVPPGAGPNLTVGRIDDKGGALRAAAARATTWRVGGVSYTVTPATNLNDLQSALTVGATALVNSYVGADGTPVATQIRGLTLDETLYMPLMLK
jgi:hypothetical protein